MVIIYKPMMDRASSFLASPEVITNLARKACSDPRFTCSYQRQFNHSQSDCGRNVGLPENDLASLSRLPPLPTIDKMHHFVESLKRPPPSLFIKVQGGVVGSGEVLSKALCPASTCGLLIDHQGPGPLQRGTGPTPQPASVAAN